MLKKVLIAALTAAILMTGSAAADNCGLTTRTEKAFKGYKTTVKFNGKKGIIKTKKRLPVKVVAEENVTSYMVHHKKNKFILVVKLKGVCRNRRGDGRTTCGSYICYQRIKHRKPGRVYTTYLVYANNNYCDDIIYRFDR